MTIADVRIPIRPLTVLDYERMVQAGILGESDRVELLKGQLSEVSPQGSEHAAILQWLSTQLIRAIDPAVAGVRVQLPLRLPPLSEPEPDIAVVPPGVFSREHPAVALLAIEISASSRKLDLGAKAEIYAAAGIREYWVVDVAARAIHVHGSPRGATYASCRAVTSGALRPEMDGVPAIDVGQLFALLR
ncbi:MAG: Uma2 family endonuclease [Solirubrobacteraceae bacterium]